MNETLILILSWIAGLVLGAIFFGGLWWTVRKGISSPWPATWFLGSLLLRTAIALAGFYFVARNHWQSLVACLVGFVIARAVVIWLTRTPAKIASHPIKEAGHAP